MSNEIPCPTCDFRVPIFLDESLNCPHCKFVWDKETLLRYLGDPEYFLFDELTEDSRDQILYNARVAVMALSAEQSHE